MQTNRDTCRMTEDFKNTGKGKILGNLSKKKKKKRKRKTKLLYPQLILRTFQN